ncbi:hypothetical protein ACQEUU_08515 [Nonomuraea sp. CA-218870]|uniref:hypothetical protein n=1 Tax=Nonomuraea sp. CA-218870 TaxID=3239998 RepID=UPI003D8FF95C
MTLIDVHVQALEECGRQALRVRNMLDLDDAFVDAGRKAPQGDTDSGIFGELENAKKLASKVDEVWEAVRDELGAARNRLGNVERSLGDVAANFREAERP